jgi:ABC-type glycerol-3-phosphate transport system permease component
LTSTSTSIGDGGQELGGRIAGERAAGSPAELRRPRRDLAGDVFPWSGWSQRLQDWTEVYQAGVVPETPTLENFEYVFTQVPFARYMFNSFLVSATVTIVALLFHSMAAYALARLRFPGREFVFSLIFATLLVSLPVILVPLFVLVRAMGLLDSYAGLIVPAIFNAFGIFLLRQFYLGIPGELEEAAILDGAGYWRVYTNIILPLSRPILAALAVFFFLANWNSFLWPLTVTSNPICGSSRSGSPASSSSTPRPRTTSWPPRRWWRCRRCCSSSSSSGSSSSRSRHRGSSRICPRAALSPRHPSQVGGFVPIPTRPAMIAMSRRLLLQRRRGTKRDPSTSLGMTTRGDPVADQGPQYGACTARARSIASSIRAWCSRSACASSSCPARGRRSGLGAGEPLDDPERAERGGGDRSSRPPGGRSGGRRRPPRQRPCSRLASSRNPAIVRSIRPSGSAMPGVLSRPRRG